MPKVPELTRQVLPGQMPNLRVSDKVSQQMFGTGEAFNQVIEAASSIAKKAKDDADNIAVTEAENKLMQFANNFMYGENGMSSKFGKDAFGLKNELDDQYNKTYDEIYKSLTSQDQKDKFAQNAMNRKLTLDSAVLRHIAAEQQNYDDKETDAFIKNEQGTAIQNYQNPDMLLSSFRLMDKKLSEYADRKGMAPDQAKLLIETNRGKTHSEIIARMIQNGDDLGAQKYFDIIKDQIPGTLLSDIEKQVEIGTVRGNAQRFVDSLMSKGIDEITAFNKAKEIENPKLRDEIETRISRAFTQKKIAEDNYQKTLLEQASRSFDQTGEIDANTMVKLKPEYAEALIKHKQFNPLRDDGVLFYKLSTLAADPRTREQFVNLNLIDKKYIGNLSKEHFQSLTKMQQDIRNGKSETLEKLNGAYSDAEIVKSIYEAAGFKIKNTEEYAKFRMSVDNDLEQYKIATGKKFLTNEEIKNIANKYTTKYATDNWFFGKEKATFQIKIGDISSNHRTAIEQALQKANIPVTEENIIKVFNKQRAGK